MDERRNGHRVLTGDLVDQIQDLERCPPGRDAPVRAWAAWFDQLADLYGRLQDRDPGLRLGFVAEHYHRKATTLCTDHKSDRPWPKAASWLGTSATAPAAPHRGQPRARR